MPTIEERALALVNEVEGCEKWFWTTRSTPSVEALCWAIEAHDATLAEFEAFKRKVSDAVEGFWNYCHTTNTPFPADLDRFIIPKPVDPLVEALDEAWDAVGRPAQADRLRAALAKRGLEVRKIGGGE